MPRFMFVTRRTSVNYGGCEGRVPPPPPKKNILRTVYRLEIPQYLFNFCSFYMIKIRRYDGFRLNIALKRFGMSRNISPMVKILASPFGLSYIKRLPILVTKCWARSWSRCTGSQPAGDLRHPSGRLLLLSARPAIIFPAAEHHYPLAGTHFTVPGRVEGWVDLGG